MTFSARVILDSIGPNQARLTTFEVTLPRIVLAEFNTHRVFSRNSASSRAIPAKKMRERVANDPFIPKRWPKNQKGMQATEYLEGDDAQHALEHWQGAAAHALATHRHMDESLDVHKAITNRLIEPFLWHTIVFTTTELDNFFALRADPMAQDEIREATELIIEAYEKSTPMQLDAGEWHLPFVTKYDVHKDPHNGWFSSDVAGGQRRYFGAGTSRSPFEDAWLYWARISAARCARVSYLTHEGKRDLEEDEKLFDRLVLPGHMSPLEHPAMALTHAQWQEDTITAVEKWAFDRIPPGNFWGWRQFRKTISYEHNAKELRAARR